MAGRSAPLGATSGDAMRTAHAPLCINSLRTRLVASGQTVMLGLAVGLTTIRVETVTRVPGAWRSLRPRGYLSSAVVRPLLLSRPWCPWPRALPGVRSVRPRSAGSPRGARAGDFFSDQAAIAQRQVAPRGRGGNTPATGHGNVLWSPYVALDAGLCGFAWTK